MIEMPGAARQTGGTACRPERRFLTGFRTKVFLESTVRAYGACLTTAHDRYSSWLAATLPRRNGPNLTQMILLHAAPSIPATLPQHGNGGIPI